MKTVLVTTLTSVPAGGVNTREMHLARLIVGRGWRMVFALAWGSRFHDPLLFRRIHPDAETVLLDGRTGTRDGRWRAVRRAIQHVNPAVVMPGALADTFEVVRQEKHRGGSARLVYGLPGVHDGANAFVNAYSGIVDQAFGVSRLTTQLLETACGIPASRVHYVPTGVVLPARLTQLDHRGPIRIGYVGRFDDDKRPMDLTALCAELEARGLDYQAIAVGGGSLAESLARAAAATPRLRVLSPVTVDQLYDSVYPQLDACLLFSAREGMPNSLLEAMAHGVVPVTSDFVGRETEGLIEDGRTGMVFPVGGIESAADRIVQLASDRALRQRLGAMARKTVEAKHSLEVMGDRFVGVLEAALECEPALASIPPLPERGSSRLSRWVGGDAAEQLRRLCGKRFNHTDDDGEWPRIGKIIPAAASPANNARG
ncbi:MAG TPA: glycosyltransferase family 4 protein [Blastocatellia bacterium]|nr:glycosyltransferase family 4 protein [Blastocatellia bacterium]